MTSHFRRSWIVLVGQMIEFLFDRNHVKEASGRNAVEMTTQFAVTCWNMTQIFRDDTQIVVGCAVGLCEASSNNTENLVMCCFTLFALSRWHTTMSLSYSPRGSKKALTKPSTAWTFVAVLGKHKFSKKKHKLPTIPVSMGPAQMFSSDCRVHRD